MAKLERFDEPTYGAEEVEFADEGIVGQLTGVLGPVKKFLPHIIAAIVIIAIAWFAYDYFVGSRLSVTITVEDTEGKLLEDSSIKVFVEGSEEPIFEHSGSSTYSVSLRLGSYRYEVTAPGYAVRKSGFGVSADETEPVIKLPKDFDVEILDFEQLFPDKLFVGGAKQFSVQLKNHSSSGVSIELLAEGDIEGMVEAGTLSIPGNSTKSVLLEVTVPAGTGVNDEKNGDEKKAVLRVKYTNEKGEANFMLYPNPAIEISLSDAELSAKARENYNKDQDTITVKNSNYFPIDDLVLSIEITSATKNDPSEVVKWFQFSEVANQPNPQQIEISSIPARGSVKKELQVIVPLTAKKEPDIKGNVVLNAPYFAEPIKKTLTLDVKEEAEYSIDLSLSPGSPISIEWDEILGKYEDKMLNLKVKNSGQLDLHNLVFSVANNVVCSPDWLSLIENSIDLVKAGETKELKLNASAPIAMRDQESSKYCNLRYRFDNPLVSGTYVEETKVSFVEIVPEAD